MIRPHKRLRFLLICVTRFPRLSCNFDAVACSRNRHVTLYSTDSQFVNIPTDQRKKPSTELPGSNLGVVDRNKYYRETCHEMRNPAVDPRKSRRHGTDFGLGRHEESPLTVLSSDHPSKAIPMSVLMQDNPATDGDSVTSLFEYALEFPQPPPIGSPVIRRMRSSPWFSDKDCMDEEFSNQGSRRPRRSASVLLDSDFLGSCYSVSSLVTQHHTMRREILHSGRHNFSDMVKETTKTERARLHLSPYLDLGINDVSLEMVGEALVGLDMNASTMGPQKPFLDKPAYGAPPSCESECPQASDSGRQLAGSHLDWSIPSDLLQWSTSHRSPPLMMAPTSQERVPSEDTLHNAGYRSHSFRTKTNPVSSLPSEHQSIRSFGRLPRIIRKVASMKSDSRRPNDSNCVPLGLPGPRTIPKSRSFRSIPLVACEAGNNSHSTITTIDGDRHQYSDWSFANIDHSSSSKHAHDLKRSFGPTLNDSLEHWKGRGAQHMSLPSSSFGSLRSEAGQHKAKVTTPPMALSGPFLYRKTCNRQSAKSENDLPIGTDKSFIDITPKQGTKHERSAAATKRARMKKLITRASNGIIGWGRQLTRKTSSVK